MNSNQTIVLYHKNCSDGKCGAFLFSLKYNNLKMVPIYHYDKPPDCSDKHVVMIDICYTSETLITIYNSAKSLTILDHHITAVDEINKLSEELKNKINFIIDINRSASEIVWDYVFNQNKNIKNKPFLVQVITDKDLYKWSNSFSRDIYSGLQLNNCFTFKKMKEILDDEKRNYVFINKLNNKLNNSKLNNSKLSDRIAINKYSIYYNLYNEGKTVNKLYNDKAKKYYNNAIRGIFKDYKVLITNADNSLINYISDISLKNDNIDIFINMFYNIKSNTWNLSLRSLKIDVAAIAKEYGGGGHKNAAGFKLEKGKNIEDYVKLN